MPIDALAKAIDLSRRGAQRAARNVPDHAELTGVAELIGNCLECADDKTLLELQARARQEAPEALPWVLSILRTLTGTLVDQNSIQHLVLIPVLHPPLGGELSLARAIHEVEGSLEYALDLGYGSLKLKPELVPFSFLQDASPSTLRGILEQAPEVNALLQGLSLSESCSAFVGRWSVQRTDRVRLMRKLLHAMQRTPDLVSWQRRTEALLSGSQPGTTFSVYPVFQLQDFFSGARQIIFVQSLEKAYREIPQAHLLQWDWQGPTLNCSLSDTQGRKRTIQTSFPDEPKEFAEMRLCAFCARRGLFTEPPFA